MLRSWSWLASTSLLFLCAGARVAAAQESDHPITLRWEAPDGCPSRDAVLEDVDRLLGGRPSASAGKRLKTTARVTRAGDGVWELALRTESDSGKGERKLRATSCRTIADAAALIIALGFDPVAVALQSRPASPVIPAPAPPGPASPGAPATPDLPGSAGATGVSPPAPLSQPAPLSPPESVGLTPWPLPPWLQPSGSQSPGSQSPGSQSPGSQSPGPASAGRPVEPAPETKRFGVGVAAGGDVGSFSETAVLLGAWVSVAYERLRFRGTVTYLPPTRTSVAERPATGGQFVLFAGGLSACRGVLPWSPVGEPPFELAGCVGAEIGEISAQGFGVTDPGEGAALWFAPRGAAVLTFALPGNAALLLDLGAAVPIGRRRFVLERVGVVHEPSPVVGRASIGVSVHF